MCVKVLNIPPNKYKNMIISVENRDMFSIHPGQSSTRN